MKKLRDLTTDDLGGAIRIIDLGASGGIKPEWMALAHLIDVIGFDPNAAECARLNGLPSGYHSAKFLPYAVAGETGRHTIYQTKSIYCWSLLRPRLEWLSRFSYSALFELMGTDTVQAYRLEDVPELAGVEIDAMKIDTQGLELPVLKSARPFLESSVWIETETGLTQNYEGETTFDQILALMEQEGFGLFGIDTNHPVPRKNGMNPYSINEQLLWCEAVWLRDFYKSTDAQRAKLTRGKALRTLCLYANHGCLAFALETAGLFRDLGLITGAEYDGMAGDPDWWRLPRPASTRAMHAVLDFIPRRFHRRIRSILTTLLTSLNGLEYSGHPIKRRLGR